MKSRQYLHKLFPRDHCRPLLHGVVDIAANSLLVIGERGGVDCRLRFVALIIGSLLSDFGGRLLKRERGTLHRAGGLADDLACSGAELGLERLSTRKEDYEIRTRLPWLIVQPTASIGLLNSPGHVGLFGSNIPSKQLRILR